jgi:hypothetical protein
LGLPGGDPASAIGPDVPAAAFNNAGIAIAMPGYRASPCSSGAAS